MMIMINTNKNQDQSIKVKITVGTVLDIYPYLIFVTDTTDMSV